MQEAHFVTAFLQVPRQLARGVVELLANASLGIASHGIFVRKREHLALGDFVCAVVVMVFDSPRPRKLKARVVTCAGAYAVYIELLSEACAITCGSASEDVTSTAYTAFKFNSRAVKSRMKNWCAAQRSERKGKAPDCCWSRPPLPMPVPFRSSCKMDMTLSSSCTLTRRTLPALAAPWLQCTGGAKHSFSSFCRSRRRFRSVCAVCVHCESDSWSPKN